MLAARGRLSPVAGQEQVCSEFAAVLHGNIIESLGGDFRSSDQPGCFAARERLARIVVSVVALFLENGEGTGEGVDIRVYLALRAIFGELVFRWPMIHCPVGLYPRFGCLHRRRGADQGFGIASAEGVKHSVIS